MREAIILVVVVYTGMGAWMNMFAQLQGVLLFVLAAPVPLLVTRVLVLVILHLLGAIGPSLSPADLALNLNHLDM